MNRDVVDSVDVDDVHVNFPFVGFGLCHVLLLARMAAAMLSRAVR